MSRQIEFRGVSKESGEWVYGNLLQSSEFKDGHIHCWIQQKTLLCLGAISTPTKSFYEVKPETVGQLTTSLDDDKTKICEGDKLKCEDGYDWVVIFVNSCFLAQNPIDVFDVVNLDDHYFKVIGNIHQSNGAD